MSRSRRLRSRAIEDISGERESAIYDWEREQQDKITEDLIDGKITFLRAGVSYERLEEEADGMREELKNNCFWKLNNM